MNSYKTDGTLPKLEVVFTPQQIGHAVARLAKDIRQDYHDKTPLLIGTLKGAFVFMADLMRSLDMPLEVDFVTLSSYRPGTTQSLGKVTMTHSLHTPIEGKHVLVIEDIVDEGQTLSFLIEYLRTQNPVSVKVCAMFDKPSRRRIPVTIDYLGLTVPNAFVVGYGLDYDEKYRNFPGLHRLSE